MLKDILFAEKIIKDFSEFSGLSIRLILKNVEDFNNLSNKEWDNVSYLEFDKKAATFYANSKYYIYDLLYHNYTEKYVIDKLNGYNPKILEHIKNHPGNKFMEFGGGIGLFCQIISKLGKDVTYLDIPGQVSDFAIWRFKKYRIPINVIISDPLSLPRLNGNLYDIIFSDAVLEHVNNPESVIEILCKHINKKGLLILLIDLSSDDKFHMHKHVDIYRINTIIKNNGLSNISGENTFCSIWSK